MTKRRFVSRCYVFPLGIFWTLYALRFYVDAHVYNLSLSHDPEELAFFIFGMCFLPMLAVLVEPGFRINSPLVKSAIATITLACLSVLIFSRDILNSNFGRLRVEGSLNQITLGHLGVSLCLLCLYLLFSSRTIGKTMKLALMGLVGFGLMIMGLASSRGPIFAFAMILPFLCAFGFWQKQRLRVFLLMSLLVCSLPFGFRAITELGSNIDQRVSGTFYDVEDGSESRLDLWQSAWEDFLENPLTGRAFDGRYGTYPHNLLLESLMTTGIVGGLAFLWILSLGLHAAWNLIRHSVEHAWLGFLFLQMFVYAMLSGALWGHFGFWYILAAVLSRWHGPCVMLASRPVKVRSFTYAAPVPFFQTGR
jgi:O-antigen ligase